MPDLRRADRDCRPYVKDCPNYNVAVRENQRFCARILKAAVRENGIAKDHPVDGLRAICELGFHLLSRTAIDDGTDVEPAA